MRQSQSTQLFPILIPPSKFLIYTTYNSTGESRKRSKYFPQAPAAGATHAQALTLPHVDYTPDHAVRRLEKALGGQHQELLEQPYEILKQVQHVIKKR